MTKTKFSFLVILISLFIIPLKAKEPSKLISEIVNEASIILSSSDPVESKIIKLNNIAEKNVDINNTVTIFVFIVKIWKANLVINLNIYKKTEGVK